MSCEESLLQPLCIVIRKGSAEAIAIRIATPTWAYVQIEEVLATSPVQIKAPEHGIPDGWKIAFENIKGPRNLNSLVSPPTDAYMHVTTVVDADTIEINKINGAGLKPYESGGQIVYRKPKSLAGYMGARMDVRDSLGGSILASYSSSTGELEIDAAQDVLWLKLSATKTVALPPGEHVFDIELIRTSGAPDRICAADSPLTVQDETTVSE